jgi:hypothetical protein
MSIFEDKLGSLSVSEKINLKLLYEVFLLKRNDSPYNFIYLTHDLKEITQDQHINDIETPRYIVRSKEYIEVRKFLGIPYMKIEGQLHTLISYIDSDNKDKIFLTVFGHEDFDFLKKLNLAFTSKYPDISIEMKLETPTAVYVYDDVETTGFWKLLTRFFITETLKYNEPVTHQCQRD